MSAAETTSSVLAEYLQLFVQTETIIFVFMEVTTKTKIIQRVIFKKAKLTDYAVFIVILGLFSIFGTYIGETDSSGAISNIRDLAPMIAGFVAGPIVGLSVGLVGGIHRLFLGGLTCVPCSIATILAGLLAGLIFRLNKGKLLGLFPAMAFAAAIELMHAGTVFLFVTPFQTALEIVQATVPPMVIAVSLGLGISMIVIHAVKDSGRAVPSEIPLESPPGAVAILH